MVAVEGKTRLTKQEGDGRQGNRGPDRQRTVVGRTSAYYATHTTNCCGCPEDVFVAHRFSCPSLSPLVVLCFLVLLFCFACHSGGARHLLVDYISFCFFLDC